MIAAMRVRPFGVAAALVVLVAALLRFDALDAGLPHPRTRPDELPVVQQMARVDRGEHIDMLIYPNAYVYASWAWVKALLAVAPVFGLEAPGGFQKTLLAAPARITLLGRSLSATAGVLAVLGVLLMARREWGDAAGLAGGLLVAVCFLHARDSHALKPDALLSLAVLASLAASARLAERASPGRVAVAGVAFGLAMSSKYTGVLMAVPLWTAAWLAARDAGATGARRWLPGSAIVAGAIGALVFAASSPRLVFEGPLLDFAHSIGGIVLPGLFPGDPAESLVGSGGALPDAFAPPPGLDLSDYRDRPWYYGFLFHAGFSMWWGTGAIATLLAPFALVWGFTGGGSGTRRPLPLLAAVTCSVQLLVMGATPAVTARYLTPLLPVLLLLEAGWLADLARRLAGRRAGVALAVAVGLVAAQPLIAILGHNRIARQTDTRVMATRWLDENLPPGSRIAFAGAVLMPYGQPQPPRDARVVAHGLEPGVLATAGAEVLVVHDHPLYFSSVDRAALASLEASLAAGGGRLRKLAEFDPRAGARDPAHEPVFEQTDAYYIPFHGFDRVARPGPRVEVYALEPGER